MARGSSAYLLIVTLALWTSGGPFAARGDEPAAPNVNVISRDEPLAEKLSLAKAAGYLDRAAEDWQTTRACATCHTNLAYLMARPVLESIAPAPPTVRDFVEEMVEARWENVGPRWDAEVVAVAAALAANDAQTTGKLHPLTRKALDKMWTLQREDGGWSWLNCGWPPMELDDHYGVTLAAIAAGVAPDNYAATPPAKEGLAKIRQYLAANPAPTAHHRAMVLWASGYSEGLLRADERAAIVDELVARRRADGGWSTANLIEGWSEHKRKDDKPQETLASDGYGTGFVTYVLRRAGVGAEDARIKPALAWLATHQRQSGRWFTPSPTKDSKHYISNAGTAFAVLALDSVAPVAVRGRQAVGD